LSPWASTTRGMRKICATGCGVPDENQPYKSHYVSRAKKHLACERARLLPPQHRKSIFASGNLKIAATAYVRQPREPGSHEAMDTAGTNAELGRASRRVPEAVTLSPPPIETDCIFEAATQCRRRFEEYLQEPRLRRKQVMEFQRRFLTWASFLGVFAPVSVCLDTRLADSPEMKELVMSMLLVLERNLQRGMDSPIPFNQKPQGNPGLTDTIMLMTGCQ